MEQRSDEWFSARLGKATASRINDIDAEIKTGEALVRTKYRIQLVTERLTGQRTETFVTAAMQNGIDTEDEARDFYIAKHDFVTETGFVDHPTIDMAGASPDGLVGTDGLIEIKVPQPHTHTEYLISRQVPKKYLNQIYWQLATMPDRKWCDFVSYCNSFPDELKMLVIRVERDDKRIAVLEDKVKKFLTEVEDTVNFLKGK